VLAALYSEAALPRAPTLCVASDGATVYRDAVERACAQNRRSDAALILVSSRLGLFALGVRCMIIQVRFDFNQCCLYIAVETTVRFEILCR
jgi:hypothetical protein